jgi:DNA-binding response OmpR family regulator
MKEEKILIVEDEKKIADSLQLGFKEQGFAADVAYDGTIGYKMFSQNRYDLAILDINLPGSNGFELCRLFREADRNMPIIFLTSFIGIDDKLEGYKMGADDYVVKPFEFKELLQKIKVFLKRKQVKELHEAHLLRAADLVMDLDAKEVTRNDKAISLTAKEFQLLEYLLRNKNKIVSRREIALQVWETDFDTNTNVIDVYINYLRNKIDKNAEQKLIHTQVGMGYILKDKAT